MKMATYTSVTRRKLIRVLTDISSAHYLFTDGSDAALEDQIRDQIKDASKEVLQDLIRVALFAGYSRARLDNMPNFLAYVANIMGAYGISVPEVHELPTKTGMDLILQGVRKYFSWKRLPYSFHL